MERNQARGLLGFSVSPLGLLLIHVQGCLLNTERRLTEPGSKDDAHASAKCLSRPFFFSGKHGLGPLISLLYCTWTLVFVHLGKARRC